MQIQNQLTAWLLRRTAATGIRRVAPFSAAIASDIGNVRNDNQDRAVISRGIDKHGRDYIVLAVADGIGGMRDGATCAALAISSFLSTINQYAQAGIESSEDLIRNAVVAANKAIFSKYRGEGGSTLVALLVRPGHPTCWLSIGDSRVYCLLGKSLNQTSIDDTIAGQLGVSHEVTPEQSKLLQFIGMGNELEPHIAKLIAEPINGVILTTDGIHFLAPSTKLLEQIVSNAQDPGVCVKRLIELAKWCGGPDNATAAMITFPSDSQQEERPSYLCLEVWDAFGELQIVSNEASREVSPIADQLLPQDCEAPKHGVIHDPSPAKPKREITKPRRNKETTRAKVSKGISVKGAAKPSEKSEEEPQLFMGFSSKPT